MPSPSRSKVPVLLGLILVAAVAGYWSVSKPPGTASDRALYEAAQQGDIAKARSAIRNGAHVNAVRAQSKLEEWREPQKPYDLGQTPLHAAASRGDLSVVKLLVDNGATIDAKDPAGNTPALLAATDGRVDCFVFLLAKGADPRARNGNGTGLVKAATKRAMTPAFRAIIDQAKRAGATP